MIIPHQDLNPDTLNSIIKEFVLPFFHLIFTPEHDVTLYDLCTLLLCISLTILKKVKLFKKNYQDIIETYRL